MTNSSRRAFLLGMGAAGAGAFQRRAMAQASALPDPLGAPSQVTAFAENENAAIRLTRSGESWQGRDIEVTHAAGYGHTPISVTAPTTRVTRIRLRWQGSFPEGWRYLGDHWERSYGDLEWRGLVGERLMPWYFLASGSGSTHGYGVKTGGASICCWQADAGGVTLW